MHLAKQTRAHTFRRFLPLLMTLSLAEFSAAQAIPSSPETRMFQTRSVKSVGQGIHIIRVSDQKDIFSQNADTLYSPASVTKLLTSAALLHYFGPEHRFTTKFFYTGTLKNGVISGNLIIEGDGDPLFISETLWQVAADLQNKGIKEIKGHLQINNSLFGGVIRDEIRLEGESASNHAYDAPVTAFGVNFNTVAIAVSPAETIGQKALVQLDPLPVKGIHIDNQIKTVSANQKTQIRATRVSLPAGESKIVVNGRIPVKEATKKIYRSVNDPVLSSGEIVRAFLKQQHIELRGKTETIASNPAGSTPLLEVKSKTISEIIHSLNLYSNNYIADVMVKRLGAEASRIFKLKEADQPGTYDNGMDAIRRFMTDEVGLKDSFTLINGSGLTTQNRLSARQLSRLLIYVAKRWDIFPEFIASLPLAGASGTLESRFSSKLTSTLKGQVRAKTGSLSSPFLVSSLAGYMHHEKHGLLVFTIIQNSPRGKNKPGILDLQESQEIGLSKLSRYLQSGY